MKTCKYGIKEYCLKDEISFDTCNFCIHLTIFKMLENILNKLED